MTIAHKVQNQRNDRGITDDVINHSPTGSSSGTVQTAQVPDNRKAGSPVDDDSGDCLIAMLPGERHLDVGSPGERLSRDPETAGESKFGEPFKDCKQGAEFGIFGRRRL